MSAPSAGEWVWAIASGGLQSAAPLMLAANGEVISERAGLLNLGIEGTMLTGACVGAAVAWASGSAMAGFAAAGVAGAIVGLLFSVWSVAAKRDQIVTGIGINLLAAGLTGAAVRKIQRRCAEQGVEFFATGLSNVEIVATLCGTMLLVVVTQLVLGYTRTGLTIRAVGENPEAADAAGVRVGIVRATAAAVGSAMAGMGGAYLSLGITNTFQEEMTGGRGFLALALVIFGRWSPAGVALGALFFGCLDALQRALQPSLGSHVHVLYPALLALPYVLTLAALAGFAGRSRPPAALAVPYERS